jgi:hypothetical protein
MMPRQVCLAVAAGTNTTGKLCTFSVLERVPLRLKAHAEIWNVLKTCADARQIVDANHPEDSFPANVLDLADLSGESRTTLEDAVAQARAKALGVERIQTHNGPFAKSLNSSFDQQREWLALRALLVQGLGQSRASAPTQTNRKLWRVLLLIDS